MHPIIGTTVSSAWQQYLGAGLHSIGRNIALNRSAASVTAMYAQVISGDNGKSGNASINTTLMKKLFYIAKRKWEPNIQHDSQLDNLWGCFEIVE